MDMLDSLADEALLERARDGDQAAFRVLVERYEDRVVATITGMLGASADVEDAAQETFVRFYRALHRFRGDAALATYLTRIAINQALNVIKRRRRWYDLFRRSDEVGGVDMEEMAVADVPDIDDIEIVRHALGQLSPEHRAVVVLRLIEGYSTVETAEMLDVPQGTVLSRLSRAQLKLREAVDRLAAISEPSINKDGREEP
jgi:RNA polymerase sigma-70 factor, ECF subfamily